MLTFKNVPGVLGLIFSLTNVVSGRGSIWSYNVDQKSKGTYSIIPSYMYEETYVSLSVLCLASTKTIPVRIHWILQEVPCMEDMYHFQTQSQSTILSWTTQQLISQIEEKEGYHPFHSADNSGNDLQMDYEENEVNTTNKIFNRVEFQSATFQEFDCSEKNKNIINLQDESEMDYFAAYLPPPLNEQIEQNDEIEDIMKQAKATKIEKISRNTVNLTQVQDRVVKAWKPGMYHFLISVSPVRVSNDTFQASVHVEMRTKSGYLPANEWPLLPYSIVMSSFYLIAGTTWVVLWARAHEHTYKIHMVIGAIAVAGAMANTLLFVNIASLNSNGNLMSGILWLVRIVSAIQDSLMHLLFMVVSTGYGITRPIMAKDIMAIIFTLVGFNFLTNVALVVVLDEELKLKYTYPIETLLVMVMYGVCLLCIGGYIVIMSISTLHHLFKRKHATNKNRVFTIYMVSSVITLIISIILIGMSFGLFSTCRKDWQHEWLYANFGHITSALLLTILMWLWVPVDTWQSYAFDPIATSEDTANMIDDDDDNDDLADSKGQKIKLTMEPI